jgi:hypothetical protein
MNVRAGAATLLLSLCLTTACQLGVRPDVAVTGPASGAVVVATIGGLELGAGRVERSEPPTAPAVEGAIQAAAPLLRATPSPQIAQDGPGASETEDRSEVVGKTWRVWWKSRDGSNIQAWLSIDDEPETFFGEGPEGSKQISNYQRGRKYEVRYYAGSERARLIGTRVLKEEQGQDAFRSSI